jgi:hypothetical protein
VIRKLYCQGECKKWLVEYDDTTDTITRKRRFVQVRPMYEPPPTEIDDTGGIVLDRPSHSKYWMKDFDPDVADLVARGIMVEPAPEPEQQPDTRPIIGVEIDCNCEQHGGRRYGGLTP